MIAYLQYLNETIGLPTVIIAGVIIVLAILNIIGEIMGAKNKIVPEFMKIRTHFKNKKTEREETAATLKAVKQHLAQQDETDNTLKEVKKLLSEVNTHYSEDNITKRNSWMDWVNNRAEVYDNSIVEITEQLKDATDALKDNTKMTEEMFVQSSRDRIIDFASKVSSGNVPVSREEFHRIFKVYERYEKFLEERKLTNGEIDINYQIIKESYETHTRERTFIEDVRGYEA